ncbi:F0F1 ATP synthase subunit A [Chloroflexota bacterium]
MPEKKRYLGCSLPILIGITVIVFALFIFSFLGGAFGTKFLPGLAPEWLIVDVPAIHLPAGAIFHVGSFSITNTLISAWISMIVLVGLSWLATHRVKLVPSGVQNLLEFALEWMLNLCVEVGGEKNGPRFFPIVTTIFLFVIVNAWTNLIPGYGTIWAVVDHHEVHLLRGANTDINFPLALAAIAFVFIWYHGIRVLGLSFFKKFVNVGQFLGGFGKLFSGKVGAGLGGIGMGFIDIFVGVLEFMSEFVRVISFTFRLFGNMLGGEILILMMMFLIPWVLAIPFYGLELFVGLIQAVVFAGLTLVFASVAATPHGGEEH